MEKTIYSDPSEMAACIEAFQAINVRQITALMFHDRMADLFDFLGLKGFKCMHEYQYLAESAEHRCTKRYFLSHHNMLLREKDIEGLEVIPDTWYKYNRFDVSTQIRKQSVETAFEKYHAWEEGTKECYCKHAKALFDMGYVADFNKVNTLIEDVDEEIKCLEQLMLTLKSVGYDELHIASIQEPLEEKYKKLAEDVKATLE